MKYLIYIFLFLLVSSCNKKYPNKDLKNQKMDAFIDNLLNKMTVDEKIGQTILFSAGMDKTGPTLDKNYLNYLNKGMLGGIFNLTDRETSRKFQKIAVEKTRLGIPLLFGYDVIHGYKTIFPIPLAQSCSWNLTLIQHSERVAAEEATSVGINWTFAPMLDISRDPRWGRVSEGSGEDTYLGSQIARARIIGFQGDDLSKTNTLLACAKHFAAYGAVIAGRDYNTVDMSTISLRNIYLPPFKAAIDQGVGTVMTAFNELNGIPCSANKFLLKNILKEEWNFKGFVVTDYTSMNEMIEHGYVENEKRAGELSLNSGVDMDMQGGIYLRNLKQLLKEKKISLDEINDAAKRILEMKYRLGLFSDPFKYCKKNKIQELKNKLSDNNYLNVAEKMSEESIVLLKNENHILPISKSKKIALIGPLVKDKSNILGSWSAQGNRNGIAISVFEGIKNLLGNSDNILYAKGCEINGTSSNGFIQAIKVANKSDLVVMVLGESEAMSGEDRCRTNLNLPGMQKKLISEIKKTGKPIILVLMNGRPLTLEFENKNADAILEAWWPGTMGGKAIANILFGITNPSGKLSMSFPRSVGQIPIFYNIKNTGRPYNKNNPNNFYYTKYIDSPNSPLYPFGFGLSYTTFKYSNFKINKKEFKFNEPIKLSVEVTNTGNTFGKEIVQLYIRDLVGRITRPIKELKRFKKIALKPHETKSVNFYLTSKDLAFYSTDGNYIAEPGNFKIFVGPNSQNLLDKSFILKY